MKCNRESCCKPLKTKFCCPNPVFTSPYASAPFPHAPCPIEISSCLPANCNESTICAVKNCCPFKCCKRC